eukprot:762551-Hanusia_phi.AAC.2
MDYQNAKIYKITNDINDEVYVGSTTQTLCKRFSEHKQGMTRYDRMHYPLYKLMDELGVDRFCISLVEAYSCSNKTELRLREGHWIRELATLNKKIEGRDAKEYRDDNKDKIAEQKKEYYANNKNKIKQYRSENKDKITEKMRQYRDDNKGKIAEQKKEWYENNKEKIAERGKQWYKEKIECECGSTVGRGDLNRHRKTKKHQAFKSQAASN